MGQLYPPSHGLKLPLGRSSDEYSGGGHIRIKPGIHPILDRIVERDGREFFFKDFQPPIGLFRGPFTARHYIRYDGEIRGKAELHALMEIVQERARIPFLALLPGGITSVVDGEIGIFRRVPPMIYNKETHAETLTRFTIRDGGSGGVKLHAASSFLS